MAERVRNALNAQAIQRCLLRWFAKHGRDLPWRKRRTPYRVWVAEIMLQQTQVATVIGYYRRWMRTFGSFRALAAAKIGHVLKCWEGLGYYRRARQMHAAARTVVAEHGGRLPRTADALRRLPGIGPYTAGAIASLAFGADEPVLDGNVMRVLCRLACIRRDPTETNTKRRLWRLAADLLPTGRAGAFNEALMDLGATVCTPGRPTCSACPLRRHCRAHAAGKQDVLPVRRRTRAVPHVDVAVGVILKRGRVLIDRRPDDGLLGGLWEFPGGKMRRGESPAQTVRREVLEEVGVEVAPNAEPFVTVRHAYSHFRITLRAVLCDHVRGRARPIQCAAVKWVPVEALSTYAFPRANQKVIAALTETPTKGRQRQPT